MSTLILLGNLSLKGDNYRSTRMLINYTLLDVEFTMVPLLLTLSKSILTI
ncbi:hypothetical protein LAV79_20500 [Peribacillus butanolivorans]